MKLVNFLFSMHFSPSFSIDIELLINLYIGVIDQTTTTRLDGRIRIKLTSVCTFCKEPMFPGLSYKVRTKVKIPQR